jgi:hypothetical protein
VAAENAALGVDLLDRQGGAVAPVCARHGAGARQLADVGELDVVRRRLADAHRHGGRHGRAKPNPHRCSSRTVVADFFVEE